MNKVSKNREKKEQVVSELLDKATKAKGMVFTNYQGLTHKQLEGFKKTVKSLEADYVATKNTLLKRVLEQTKNEESGSLQLNQPTATLFLYNDLIGPLKELTKIIKELKLPVIKFGIIEGKFVSEADVVKLASLPPLPVLRAQLLGQMNAPISGLHRALNWNLQNLVMTLKAIENKKQTVS